MKRYSLSAFLFISLVAFLAMNGCTRDDGEPDFDDPSSLMVQLSIRGTESDAQATGSDNPTTEPGASYEHTKPGVENENRIDHISVLFYEPGAGGKLKWLARYQDLNLIDARNHLYAIKIPDSKRPLFQNKTYDIIAVANEDESILPALETPIEALPDKIVRNHIYDIKAENGKKVNKPDSFVMTAEIANKTINIDERAGRNLGNAEFYRLASKITCHINVIQNEHFKMFLDETKPVTFRIERAVYNSSLARPTDRSSFPNPMKRTIDGDDSGSTQLLHGEYLPIEYTNAKGEKLKQPFYSYLWKEGDAPKLVIKVYLKKTENATESTAYYYEIPIAKPLNDQTGQKWEIKRNTWYDVTLNISTEGQLSDKDPIHIDGTYVVSEWTRDQKYYNYRIYGYRYLYVPQKEIVIVNPYNPSCKEFDRNTKAKDDMRTIAFDTTLPDIEAVVVSADSVSDEKAFGGLAGARIPIKLTDEQKKKMFVVDNDNRVLKLTLPFPGFEQYERQFKITLRSKKYTEFKEDILIRQMPRFSVAMNNLVGFQSIVRGEKYKLVVKNTVDDQGNRVNAGSYNLVDFGGGQKPDDDIRKECITYGLRKKGKQISIFKVTRAPEGAVIGYPPMDQAQFYRFEDIQGDDMKAVEAYDPGGGAPNTTPKSYRLREDLPPVTQSFTRMDEATEKMVSPKFMMASDLGAMYPVRYYSAFKKNGYLAQPMDRDGMYHDDNANYRAHKEDITKVYELDMQNGLYKNNVIYKPKDAKYAYVNINLLATNIYTRLSQYWEIKGHNFNYEFYNNPSPKNPYGASPQALIGIDALNFCAQYWEDVKLPDGRTKRITNWRIPTRAEMELIGAIQFNQKDEELPKGSYDNLLQKYKDENIFIWLIARTWFHNNGYIIFQPEYKNDNDHVNFCANPYGISYDFAYPGSFTYTNWLGYYTLFVRCVHDIDRYEKE